MKYIDADLLRKEIERQIEINKGLLDGQLKAGCLYAFHQILSFLDSLPEQPVGIPSAGSGAVSTTPPKFKLKVKEQPEGLEEEFDEECHRYFNSMTPEQFLNTPNTVIARHFYELGLNARKEEK